MDVRAEPGEGVLPDAYRPAVSADVPEGRACGNCQFYDESLTQQVDGGVEVWCRLWAAFVRGDYYCDRWQPMEAGDDVREQRQVDTDPPAFIRSAAERGLELRAEGFGGDGLTDKTIREARDMAAGRVSEDKVVRAAAWGARHAVDLDAPQNSDADDDGWPGAGAVAHYLWGINPLNPGPARAWFERKSEQIKDERSKEPPMKRGQMKQVREVRNYGLTDVEVREEDDGGAVTFSGYATVFNRNYEVYDAYGMFQERIAPMAFDRTLREEPDVVLVINHAGLPLARTKSGTLRLEPDAIGLRVYAELDSDDPDVRALLPKMRRGDVDEMSFAFRVVDDVWTPDYSEREITQVNLHRGDVSVVTFGANPHTMAMVRAALADESVREQLAADPQVARVLTTSSMQETEVEEVAVIAAPKKKKAAEPVVEADDEERSAEDVDWAVTVMARLLETKKVS
jgi:HK97 family phage prohead protease